MADETRQLKRRRQREALKQAEAFARRGLGGSPSPDTLRLLALACSIDLADPAEGGSRAARRVHAVLDATMKADPPKDVIACRKGCSYCCSSIVSASAPEVFLVAARIRQLWPDDSPARTRAVSQLAATAGLPRQQRFGAKLACGLLDGSGACSVYADRPLVCRQVLSFSLQPCLEEYDGIEGDVSVPAKPLRHAGNCGTALLAALIAAGRPTERYELSAAVLAVLADERSETRWLAGENVLAGVATLDPWPAQMMALAQRIAAGLQQP